MDFAIHLREIRRLLRQDRRDRVGRRVPPKRPLARQHLVEDRPKGEEIRPTVGGLAAHLLGRHVAHRPENDAGLSSDRPRRELGHLLCARLRLRQFRQTEVENLEAPVFRDEQVLGLEIPMDDPLLVRGRESPRDLDRVVQSFARRERPRRETAAQRVAFEKLADHIRRALDRSDVVDRRDVRMVQDSRRARFVLEAAQPIRILRERRRQHFDSDLAAEPRILRAVDLPHPTRAERRDDLVGTEPSAGRETHFASPTRKRCDSIRRNV